jgi:ribonucleoside-diphosphate reductase alpha chain
MNRGERETLPKRRRTVRYSIEFGGARVHLDVGYYDDGRVGEVFVAASKTGSALRYALETWARCASKALQYGMPLSELVKTLRGTPLVPAFVQSEPYQGPADSIWDALARVLERAT